MKALKERVMKCHMYVIVGYIGTKSMYMEYFTGMAHHSFCSQRVACLLRKVVQEIERRISTQAEHLRTVRIILDF